MRTPAQPGASSSHTPSGPLAGLPVAVQWLAVAAAIVAAAVGLRYLYDEATEPPEVWTAVERKAIPANEPAMRPAPDRFVEPPEETTPSEVSPRSSSATSTPEPDPAPVPENPAAHEAFVRRQVPVPVAAPASGVHHETPVEYLPETSLEERLRSRLGEPGELHDLQETPDDPRAGTVRDDPETPVDAQRPSDVSDEEPSTTRDAKPPELADPRKPVRPGPPGSIGGVAVLSLRWNGRDVEAEVHEDAQADVTLVTLQGLDGYRRSPGTRPGLNDRGARSDRPHTPTSSRGIYYFRVFMGSTEESVDPDSHGLLGNELRVLPSGDWTPRRGRPGRSGIVGGFDLSSSVGLDPVWLPAEGERTRSEFVAAAARRLYDVTVAGAPAEIDGWHEMRIGISHRHADHRGRPLVELEALVQKDHNVVLRIPDPSAGDRVSEVYSSVVDTVLVAFTPLFAAGAGAVMTTESFYEHGTPAELIVLQGLPPLIPVELLSDPAVLGDLRLRILVHSSGKPGTVVATETAHARAEYLVEPVVSAIRKWRFHPPDLAPGKFGAYFDVTIGPDGELRPVEVRADSTRR